VARVLIVGGGCRGLELAEGLVGEGHAVRITTRSPAGRAAIEGVGGECWIGTPDRLATLRGALDSVTVACWLLASASGPEDDLRALHTTRLEFFLTQAIDTTVRGFLYEASPGRLAPALLAEGERIVRTLTARNEIPFRCLTAVLDEREGWLGAARDEIGALLGPG
jgi:hypothetical protein